METDHLIPYDFILLVLGIAALVTTVVLGYCVLKKRRLHRLTNPRKDYYRPCRHGERLRTHRIDKIDV